MSAAPVPSPASFLAVGFLLVYFGARRLGLGPWIPEGLMVLPAAYAAAAHGRRALAAVKAERRFFGFLALSGLLWTIGQALWAGAVFHDRDPSQPGAGPWLDLLFLGFLVPALAAVLLGPGPRLFRPDSVDRLDAALLVMAQGFVFLRLVFLPLAAARGAAGAKAILLGVLCLVLAVAASARFRFADVPAERRAYGLVALFGTAYGVGSVVGNGLGPMPSPGTAIDLVWFIPFFILASAAASGRRAWPPLPSSSLFVAAGALPLLLVLLGELLWGAHGQPEIELLLSFAALVGLASALRLGLQEDRDVAARRRDRERLEEERRSGRLDSLQAVSGPLLADLRRGLEFLALRCAGAAAALGAEAPLVRLQVERAQSLLAGLEASLGRGREEPPEEVNVARLVEETLQAEVDRGLPIRVRLSAGSAGAPVMAVPRSLGAAFRELARNAAQASPGGSLDVRLEREGAALLVRFRDDGPGIPEDIRRHVFDPFFTTRPAGAGAGLGLTLVHFVVRDLGGSARLEPPDGRGAEVALRLPLADRRSPRSPGPPLVLPILGTAALAIVATAMPVEAAARFAPRAAAALALLAAYHLGRAARRPGLLWFFGLLAFSAALAGLALLAEPSLVGFADWPLAAAVLLPLSASSARLLGPPSFRVVALLLFLALHLVLVIVPSLPLPAEPSVVWAVAGGALRLFLAVAARVLASRVDAEEPRRRLQDLSVVLVLWAVGTSATGLIASLASLGVEPFLGLALVLPLLQLLFLGREEAGRGRRAPPQDAEGGPRDLAARGPA